MSSQAGRPKKWTSFSKGVLGNMARRGLSLQSHFCFLNFDVWLLLPYATCRCYQRFLRWCLIVSLHGWLTFKPDWTHFCCCCSWLGLVQGHWWWCLEIMVHSGLTLKASCLLDCCFGSLVLFGVRSRPQLVSLQHTNTKFHSGWPFKVISKSTRKDHVDDIYIYILYIYIYTDWNLK